MMAEKMHESRRSSLSIRVCGVDYGFCLYVM